MSEASAQAAVAAAGTSGQPWWEGQLRAWDSEVHALLGAVVPGEFIVQVGLPVDGRHLPPENLRATLAHTVAKLVEVAQRAVVAEALVKRWEAEAAALMDITIPKELVVPVCEGNGPEDLRASLAVSVAKLVEATKPRFHRRSDGQPLECSICKIPVRAEETIRGTGDGAGESYAHGSCYWMRETARAEQRLVDERRAHEGQVKTLAADFQRNQDQWQEHTKKLEAERDRQERRGDSHMQRAHTELKRAEKAEAEVKRVQGLIDRDRTGLATGLAAIAEAVKGYWWLADGGWGSYEDKDRTETTLRQEFTAALELVAEICKRHLGQSGDRANAAFHGGDGPAESIDLGRMRLLAEAQCDEMAKLAENLRRQVKDLAEKHRGAMLTASRTAADPARTLREQVADERAALLGMFPNDLVIYAQGGTGEENARKTLATSLGALLRAFEETKAIADGLQQGMTAINDALDEFGAQHPREGRTDLLSLDECVTEAMTTLRANLAEVRAENGRLRKDVQALDGQAAVMRGVLEMARDWLRDFSDTEPVGGAGDPCSVNIAQAVVGAIGEALKAEAGESLRAREVWLLQEYAAEVMADERPADGPEATYCRKCETRTLRPAPDQPFPTHQHTIRCPLFYLGDAAYQGGPKMLRREVDQQRARADAAEATVQRLEFGLEVVLKGIPDRLIQPIGGVDNLERLRSTLAVTVPHLLRELATAEAKALELEAKLDMAANRAENALGHAIGDQEYLVIADARRAVKKAISEAVDPSHLHVLGRLQREAQAAEDKAARARVATDEARERQERAEARAEQVAADAAAKDKARNQSLLYYQGALAVANALLEEAIGMVAAPHPLGLTHAQMLGEPPEVDQKEVYRLRKVLEAITQSGWWVNATVLGARRAILLAAALECEGRATRADGRFKEMVPGRYIGEAIRDISQHFATMAVEEPSADERRRLAEGLYTGTAGGGKAAAMDQLAREAEARGEVVVRVRPDGGEGQK